MKFEKFAKVFTFEKYGEVLVFKDSDDGDPKLMFSTNPEFGRVDSSLTFIDTDEGWEARDRAFDSMDRDRVEKYVEEEIYPKIVGIYEMMEFDETTD